MFNSVIIEKTVAFFKLFSNCYNNSTFNNLLMKTDKFLKNMVLNSYFFRIFATPNNDSIPQNSYAYKIFSFLLSYIRKTYSIVKKCFSASYLIFIGKNIIDEIFKNPFRLVGLFGTASIISNILCNVILGTVHVLPTLIQTIIALLLFPLTGCNASLKKLVRESYFCSFFRWIISL